jgi:hypothetical protein
MFSQYPLPMHTNYAPQEVSDPVACCLRNSMFTCVDNPNRIKVGQCTDFMSQRCSANWDGKCDLFLQEKLTDDYTGKAANEFLTKTLEKKFCRLDTSNPATHCFEKQTQYNPLAYGKGKGDFDMLEGDFVYRPNNKLLNISTNNFAYGRLDSASPIKIAKCPKTCDKINSITNDDRVVNECLDRGTCIDAMQNIAENLVANSITTSNDRLNNFIDRYIMQPKKNLQVGFASTGNGPYMTTINKPTPGPSDYIPPNQTYQLDEDIGNFANEMNPVKTTEAEKFRFRRRRQDSPSLESGSYLKKKDKNMIMIVVLIVLISYVLYLYFK